MVETGYDLCQPSMFTTMFPSKPGFKFFLSLGNLSLYDRKYQSDQNPERTNTAAKRLCLLQVEHFRSLFQSHFPVRSKSPVRCAGCGSVVLLHAARVFDYFVVIEIAFMDNQAQITETISRLDSEKVS